MQSASIINMKNIDLNTVDRDELVDIRDVKVNTALPKRERAIDFIRQIGNPYCYKHGKYVVLRHRSIFGRTPCGVHSFQVLTSSTERDEISKI